jgi:hypothetical protein
VEEKIMKWQQLLTEMYEKLPQLFEEVLDGLTLDDLHKRPAPDANTIGWLLWHVARSLDRTVGDVIRGEQVWIKDGYFRKFGREPDPNETGVGHSFEDVANLRIPDSQTLLDYFHAVIDINLKYIAEISEDELDRQFDNSLRPGTTAPVHQRIAGNIGEHFQHIGQAAYVRGLLKGQGWLGR